MKLKPPPSQKACRRMSYGSAKPKCHIVDPRPTKTAQPFSPDGISRRCMNSPKNAEPCGSLHISTLQTLIKGKYMAHAL